MSNFENTVIGFFVAWSIAGSIGLIAAVCIAAENAAEISQMEWQVQKIYESRFGYTKCWRFA